MVVLYLNVVFFRILNQQDTVRKNNKQAQSIKQEIGDIVENNTDIFSKVLYWII